MFLQNNIKTHVEKNGGRENFTFKLIKYKEITKNKENNYIINTWIMYINLIYLDVDMKVEKTTIKSKQKIEGYVITLREMLTDNYCPAIETCLFLMIYNLNYCKDLRFLN